MTRWLEETRAVFCQLTQGPQVLVGSSMGGYIALLLLRASDRSAARGSAYQGLGADRAGLGHDRTDVGEISASARKDIQEKGVYLRPSDYGDGPYPITRAFIEDGRRHLIGSEPLDPGRPVHILHGLQDPDVPWEHTLDLVAHLTGDWVRVSAVPDGEHRLSRPEDIALLIDVVRDISDGTGSGA